MKVVTIGGGPAGLYHALLLKKQKPDWDIQVLERNKEGETFGWGVVFSDQTLSNFKAADEPSYREITGNFSHWDDIDIHIRGTTITSSGHGFCGISRKKLLQILSDRATDLGVSIEYGQDIADLNAFFSSLSTDQQGRLLVVAADGVNSRVRTQYAERFKPSLDLRPAKYIWFGTTLPFDAFTFAFVENDLGTFQAHCYRFEEGLSTFIVECDEESWTRAGFDRADTETSIRICENLFAEWLGRHRLMSNASHRAASPWTSFLRVTNENWHTSIHGVPTVLIGDAAHTAHFSIGSGTKLAMEDAIALASHLSSRPLEDALTTYQEFRSVEALRIQNAARNSMEWFENVRRYTSMDPVQFGYSLLTRSQRVSHDSLRLRDRDYLSGVERWFASAAEMQALGAGATGATSEIGAPPPPLFTPFRLRNLKLQNRVVVAPMDMYRAENGIPTDFHLTHLGSRAIGGAALIVTEMTCVSAEGRITPGCCGIYNDAQEDAWKRIVSFVHNESDAKIALQIGHSGRKGSTKVPWEGKDAALDTGGWEVTGPSPIRYAPQLPVPKEITRSGMTKALEEFVAAAERADRAGFDMLELHAAHGYLLSSFLTPISNQRTDEYGGSLENRTRYPLEVFNAVRKVWPADKPMSVRVSATDWTDGGISKEEAVKIATAFMDAGADIIHVSTGQTTSEEKPVFGRLYQTPFSDLIRNEGKIPTIAVGNITDPDQVNSIIASGRADLCALGRPHLSNPYWTLHAAAKLGYSNVRWSNSYYPGRVQLEREEAREREREEALEAIS